jgi:hypothetical protein
MRHRFIAPATLLLAVAGCASLQQLAALRQVDFSLAGVRNSRLAGVRLESVSSYRDVSATDLARIALAVAQKDLPFEFQLDVTGLNPTDNKVTARLVRLAWSLVLNDKETITGVLDTTLSFVPGVATTFPMQMRLNLLEFFDGPAQGIIDLAASLAGLKRDPTRIALRAVPTIDTPLGRISYPTPVTIISRTVGGSGAP